MSNRSRIISGLGAEVSFAVLPLLVVSIVLFHQGPFVNLFASPEWSFGAAILFGQALVKFVSGFALSGRAPIGSFTLTVALLIVFGLVPSLVVNAMTVMATEAVGRPAESRSSVTGVDLAPTSGAKTSEDKRPEPTVGLQVSQVILFVASSLIYILLGTVGEVVAERRPHVQPSRN